MLGTGVGGNGTGRRKALVRKRREPSSDGKRKKERERDSVFSLLQSNGKQISSAAAFPQETVETEGLPRKRSEVKALPHSSLSLS